MPQTTYPKSHSRTTAQATALWADLRHHLMNAERVIAEIIETRAWEPLGYSSFAEAWDEQNLSDITFAPEIRAHVVYALLDGGLADEEVAAQVKGVGRARAERLREQKSDGVPASDARTAVKRVVRSVHSDGSVHYSKPAPIVQQEHFTTPPLRTKGKGTSA